MFHAYAEGTALEPIALKAAMVRSQVRYSKPVIMLPVYNSGYRHGKKETNNLMIEAGTIQRRLKTSRTSYDDKRTSCHFAQLMMQGKVKAAICLLSDEGNGQPLPLNSFLNTDGDEPPTTIRDELLRKHPPTQPVHPDTLLQNKPTSNLQSFHPVILTV